jgi:hypothetical protein
MVQVAFLWCLISAMEESNLVVLKFKFKGPNVVV